MKNKRGELSSPAFVSHIGGHIDFVIVLPTFLDGIKKRRKYT